TPARPMTSRWCGWRCWCSPRWRSSCTSRCRGWNGCCRRASIDDSASSHPTGGLMNRRKFLSAGASLGGVLVARPFIARAAARELIVAEPVHSTGYLPMYVGMAKNYFAEADITVKILTIETGSGHTNAVLSGQAFAFIGGPEHNAF